MSRTIEDRKQELIIGLNAARIGVMDAAGMVKEDRRDELFLGDWSIKDLLAHLVGWDHTNLQAIKEVLSGKPPAFYRYYDSDWHSYNRLLLEKYKIEPYSALLEEIQKSHLDLVSYLEGLPAFDIVNGKSRSDSGRTVTVRNLIQSETDDEQKHAMQIRNYFSR